MKTLGLILGLCMTVLTTYAQDTDGVTVTVTLENVLNSNGKILAGLHTVETFMKGQGIDGYMNDAKTGEMTFTFENVVPGTYAVSVLHDENNNMAMDFESNGMPKENYGMSGNLMEMGPPTFEGSKFEVEGEDVELKIRF
ncbi:DUF2141 domain-containing protein [Muriicola sp. Z0-33]|uniref:DUF2141 domain-containing protein n=1 Tax=Muriicola sp. Z0-33 TaxID=2816957 RepID=UPI0022389303|nr:DUF2141 domain-containing protein [Muriicola sp. Z0-33]MCW5516985.1 DUF2141 domain-containing protein [Muriicola sp. Z0-33]